MKTHLSLFSGVGGLDIAAEWAGFTTVGRCEFADYPTKVLEAAYAYNFAAKSMFGEYAFLNDLSDTTGISDI